MTRDEVVKMVRFMKGTFSNFKPDNLSETVDAWTMIFADDKAEDIMLGLVRYSRTEHNGFAPSPGQILAMIPKETLSEMEAWGLVCKAVRNSSYRSEEEFAKLPEDVQRAVGSADILASWAGTPEEAFQTVIQSNFMRSYRAISEQSKRDRIQIGANNNNLLEGGKDGTYTE